MGSTIGTRVVGEEPPVLRGRPDDSALTDALLWPIWRPSFLWKILFAWTGLGVGLLVFALYSFLVGPGLWGNNIPVAWAFPIVSFVWWIGIGHAGTFISAFLLLMAQEWRASINRVAEAMTLFALVQAGLYPLLHLGRQWFAYWLFPYPAPMAVWPQFRSSLPWDVFAVSTYFIVSVLFWYQGLVPDLATARDRAPGTWRRRIYGVFALGWRGSAEQWRHYRMIYLLLGGLATPLVISVHSVVSLDFTIAIVPGWHSTIFPPYFVAGAIYSGFAMVLLLIIPIRHMFRVGNVITERHLDNCAKLLLTTGLIVGYTYVVELFIAWYSADPYERHTFLHQLPFGWYSFLYWCLWILNVGAVQVLWSPKLRRNEPVLFGVSLAVLAGMWIERFVIISVALSQDFLPSSWHPYRPTLVDWAILAGTVSLFSFLMLVFLRFVPAIPIHEVKRLRHDLSAREEAAR